MVYHSIPHGAVAVYIADSLKYRIVAQSPQSETYVKRAEFMFISLKLTTTTLLIGLIYSTPKSGYWSDVEEALLNCNAAQDYTILLGDFNIN